jgi:hypothetical protein
MTTIRRLTGNAAWPRLRMASAQDLRLRTGMGTGVGSSLADGRSRGIAGTNERHDGGGVSPAGDAM